MGYAPIKGATLNGKPDEGDCHDDRSPKAFRRLLHEVNVERRGLEEVAEYADTLRAHLNGIDVAPEAKSEQQPAQAAQQPAKVEEPSAVEGLDTLSEGCELIDGLA